MLHNPGQDLCPQYCRGEASAKRYLFCEGIALSNDALVVGRYALAERPTAECPRVELLLP